MKRTVIPANIPICLVRLFLLLYTLRVMDFRACNYAVITRNYTTRNYAYFFGGNYTHGRFSRCRCPGAGAGDDDGAGAWNTSVFIIIMCLLTSAMPTAVFWCSLQ